MRKRVALKILKMKDKLRYKPQQILKAQEVAKRYGLNTTAGQQESGESQETSQTDSSQ